MRRENIKRKMRKTEKREGIRVSNIEVKDREKLRKQKRGWKEKRRGNEGNNELRGVERKKEKREREEDRERVEEITLSTTPCSCLAPLLTTTLSGWCWS